MIELGRYNQTTKDNRHCPFWGSSLIKDEVHFLFHCPTSLYDREFLQYNPDSDSKYYLCSYL